MNTIALNPIGRLGNQMFEYAFMRKYAKRHGFRLEVNNWLGRKLFGHNDPFPSKHYRLIIESNSINNQPISNGIWHSNPPVHDVIMEGYFQYHTSFYRTEMEDFKNLFRPVEKGRLDQRCQVFNNRTVIGCHLRRGDFGFDSMHPITPSSLYLEWLDSIWNTVPNPLLFLCSDEYGKVAGDFTKYNPITFGEVYDDFYALMNCQFLAVSNSTFSFLAAMLNSNVVAMRPDPSKNKLVRYDPWDSQVALG